MNLEINIQLQLFRIICIYCIMIYNIEYKTMKRLHIYEELYQLRFVLKYYSECYFDTYVVS